MIRLLVLFFILTGWAAAQEPFLMVVVDVFRVPGQGTVVQGKVLKGRLEVGQPVELVGLDKHIAAEVTGIRKFRLPQQVAEAGQEYGIVLKGVNKDDAGRGQVLATPGSVKAAKTFVADTSWLSPGQGGRVSPVTTEYEPELEIRGTGIHAQIVDLGGQSSLPLGGKGPIKLRLRQSLVLEKGLEFTVTESGRTVGSGTVVEVLGE